MPTIMKLKFIFIIDYSEKSIFVKGDHAYLVYNKKKSSLKGGGETLY
jgi:hypothetical protein